MSYSFVFMALSAVFGGLLYWGLKSGTMPSKPIAVERSEYRTLYWVNALLLFLFSAGCLAAAVHQALNE